MRVTKNKLIGLLTDKRAYLRWSDKRVAKQFQVSEKMANKAKIETKLYLRINNIGF
jgi:hypothetical protein